MKKILCSIIVFIMCFTISNVNASNTFYDTRGTKYEGVVERMSKLGIVNGMTSTTYAPNKGVTRAELAKILTKIKGIEDFADSVEYKKYFKDVKKSDWFYPYVMMAADLELMNGYGDFEFKPNQEVTYAELMAILLRNLGYTRISEESENGWYWNYITRMREIELNDNVGEFNYDKPAKRGDVAMFVWNALITDRWAIAVENEKEGFTYTYSDVTPLEMFFDEYSFLDNATVNYIGGKEERIIIGANGGYFYTEEKTPLYALGGKITALYNIETSELIGVTFDEDYEDIEIVSGPKFFLEEEGYRPVRASKTAYYGNKKDANYLYLVINKNTQDIIRAVYLDATNSIVIDSVSVKDTKESGDISTLKDISINGKLYSSMNFAVMDDGFVRGVRDIKKGAVLTNLENGLYAYSNETVDDILTGFEYNDDVLIIDEDKYIVSKDCPCYLYKAKDSISFDSFSSKELSEYLDKDIEVTLNIAEEICVIKFGKTDADNEKYKIGYVTETFFNSDKKEVQKVRIDYGNNQTRLLELKISNNVYMSVGDLVSITLNDKGIYEYKIIDKNTKYSNDISVLYAYDAKKINYPVIGEYMVTEDTYFYKATLEYEDNSVTKIKSCNITNLEINKNNFDDLEAYILVLICDENMEIIKVYAVNEINKFDNQIALVKYLTFSLQNKEKVWKATLSVMKDAVRGYKVTSNIDKFIPGDIITFTYKESNDTRTASLEEVFKKEFIGYKRDLVVKKFDRNNKIVHFEDGSTMDLTKDIYNWNGKKINLNKYRFVIAGISDIEGYYQFDTLEIHDKEKLVLKENDRFAIGELQDVIVIYRGYEE